MYKNNKNININKTLTKTKTKIKTTTIKKNKNGNKNGNLKNLTICKQSRQLPTYLHSCHPYYPCTRLPVFS